MPFLCAKCSHLVGSLGLGNGLARGSSVVDAGSATLRPVGPLSPGRPRSALKRACVSAVACALQSASSRVAAAAGSNALRLPKSSSIASDMTSLHSKTNVSSHHHSAEPRNHAGPRLCCSSAPLLDTKLLVRDLHGLLFLHPVAPQDWLRLVCKTLSLVDTCESAGVCAGGETSVMLRNPQVEQLQRYSNVFLQVFGDGHGAGNCVHQLHHAPGVHWPTGRRRKMAFSRK